MTKTKSLVISLIATIVIVLISFYFALPAINVQSPAFWVYITFILIFFNFLYSFLLAANSFAKKAAVDFPKIGVILMAIPVVVLIIGGLISSTMFNAKRYASIINVEDAVFEEDMPESDSVSNIALMDTESATIIGNRALGALSEVVSQYEISPTYTQINYHNTPQKVANLEYADFFKWLSNRSNGIPGYIMVDPVNNTATYEELETPIRYVSSAYFGENLYRALRFDYPTKIFDSVYFELDEEGNPYYIVSCLSSKVGLFGAKDVSEVIIFNPCDGSSVLYPVEETPAWVDIVYTGDLASKKFNWYGMLSGGFFNSIIGNKDCKQTTDDYGYVVLEDDVWYFTGVTSVNSDESNIGFVLSNARTGQYKYYPVVGAEEYSAMAAAEGQVQETGYVASFPSLINVSGEATYILVLKDNGGLVKLYALVNVENYGIVATGSTQEDAFAAYKRLLSESGVVDVAPDDIVSATVTVETVRLATLDGSSVVYITAENGDVYKGYLSEDESLILIREGDSITVEYSETDIDGIYLISSWR